LRVSTRAHEVSVVGLEVVWAVKRCTGRDRAERGLDNQSWSCLPLRRKAALAALLPLLFYVWASRPARGVGFVCFGQDLATGSHRDGAAR
jgi:hypothetical protein